MQTGAATAGAADGKESGSRMRKPSTFPHFTFKHFLRFYEHGPHPMPKRQHDGYIQVEINLINATQTPNQQRRRTCVGFSVTIVRKICTGRRGKRCLLPSLSRWTWLCLPCTARGGAHSVMDSEAPEKWPLNCVPPASVSPIRYAPAVKTGGQSVGRVRRPALRGCQGAFLATQLIRFPIPST